MSTLSVHKALDQNQDGNPISVEEELRLDTEQPAPYHAWMYSVSLVWLHIYKRGQRAVDISVEEAFCLGSRNAARCLAKLLPCFDP
jgi:hypothetical protein